MRTKLFLVVLSLLFATNVNAQDSEWNANVKGGVFLPGTVTIEGGGDADTEMGFMVSGDIDAMMSPKFSFGAFAWYVSTSFEEFDVDASVLGIGGKLKGRFPMESGFTFRPGVSFAYQLTTIDVDDADDVTGFQVGGFVEGVYPLDGGNAVVGELGFNAQPAGGNDDGDVTWGPIFYVQIGYEFGG